MKTKNFTRISIIAGFLVVVSSVYMTNVYAARSSIIVNDDQSACNWYDDDKERDPFSDENFFVPGRVYHFMNRMFDDDITRTNNIDMETTDKEYILSLDLPGMDKQNINIELNDNILTIEGERTSKKEKETNDKDRKAYCVAQKYGSFARRIQLPDDTDSTNVTATYERGVLDVHIGRKPVEKDDVVKVSVK